MMNPMNLMKIMNAKKTFEENHPKFVAFLNAVFLGGGIPEGTVIEVKVTKPGEETIEANMRVQQSDLQLVEELKGLSV